MFFKDSRSQKSITSNRGARKKILSTLFVLGIGILLPFSSLIIDLGPNPTGIYRQKAAAQVCYDGDQDPRTAVKTTDCNKDAEGDKPVRGKCYEYITTRDRSGSTVTSREVDCIVPTSAIADKPPICTRNGKKEACGDSQSKGKCYDWGRKGIGATGWEVRHCTTKDYPDYNPENPPAATKAPNRCFDEGNKEYDCPAGFAGNEALCYKQSVRKQLREISCQSIDNPTAGGDTSTDNNATCETTASPLTWIVCPIINALAEASDFIFDQLVKPMLVGRDLGYTDSNEPLYNVWSSFRVIANILLIIALLIVVFGQSIGGGMVDAYTAKKVIPRVLAVAILINISIYLVVLALDITNIIGAGISNLIYAPFGQNDAFTLKLGSGAGAAATLGVAGGVGALWVGGLAAIQFIAVFLLLPAALSLIGAFATLIIRQGIIVALIVSSPIAFAAYVLPNTEKYFKQWWGLFIKTLMVYPIVMIIFALADIMSAIISDSFGYAADWLADLVSLALLIIPLFLIPFAFKMAGGAIGSLYGTFSNWGKQGGEFIKGNPNDQNSLRNRSRYKVGDNTTQFRERAVKAGSKDGSGRVRRNFGRAMNYGNLQAKRSAYNKQRSEMQQSQIATGDDTNIRDLFIAQASDGNWYRRMDMKRQADGSLVADAGIKPVYDAVNGAIAHKKSMSLYGKDKSSVQDGLYYEWKKTSFNPEQMQNLSTQYGEVLDENGFDDDEGKEMGKGVGFRHQAQTLASKHSTWGKDKQTGEWGMQVNHLDLAKETALNLGTYQLSNQDVTTFDEYTKGFTDMEQIISSQGTASDDTVLTDKEVDKGSEYEGKTYAQIKQAHRRIRKIAVSTNPDQRMGAVGDQVPKGPDGALEGTGYGGVSNAPVEVQAAARRLSTVVGASKVNMGDLGEN